MSYSGDVSGRIFATHVNGLVAIPGNLEGVTSQFLVSFIASITLFREEPAKCNKVVE
jgi:hypothetical protein